VIRLGHWGFIHQVELDTKHFKGNYPDFSMISGLYDPKLAATHYKNLKSIDWNSQQWTTVLEKSPLNPHQRHFFFGEHIKTHGPFTHIKITIFPDGGVSRLRIFGFVKDPATFVKEQDMPILLCQATKDNDVHELARLVQVCKVDVNSADFDRRTALHVAATEGNFKVVQWLVSQGASLSLKDRWGNTAVDDAKKAGFTDIATFLENNPDPEKLKDSLGLRTSSIRL